LRARERLAPAYPPTGVQYVELEYARATSKQLPPAAPPEIPAEPRKIVIDTLFSHNSVFNASPANFRSPLLPEPNRVPFLAAAIFAFMLLGFLVLRYNWAATLLGPADVDAAKQESVLTAEDKANERRKV